MISLARRLGKLACALGAPGGDVDMPMQRLTAEEINTALHSLSGWSGNEKGLERRLEFEDFRGAMNFMQACVEDIERLNHHPVWTNKYNGIDIHLDTFDIGNFVTELDINLARAIDRILAERGREFGLLDHD